MANKIVSPIRRNSKVSIKQKGYGAKKIAMNIPRGSKITIKKA